MRFYRVFIFCGIAFVIHDYEETHFVCEMCIFFQDYIHLNSFYKAFYFFVKPLLGLVNMQDDVCVQAWKWLKFN